VLGVVHDEAIEWLNGTKWRKQWPPKRLVASSPDERSEIAAARREKLVAARVKQQ
jgi:hypothetical protein